MRRSGTWPTRRSRIPGKDPDYPILNLSADGRRLYVALTGEDLDRPSACTTSPRAGSATSARSDILDEIGAFAGDLSPDGSTFAVATASEVYRYDTTSLRKRGRDVEAGAGDYVDRLEYSHDGSMLAAPTRAGSRCLSVETEPSRSERLADPRESSWGIAVSADDRTLFSSGDGLVPAWDLTGRRRALLFRGEASNRSRICPPCCRSRDPTGRALCRAAAGRAVGSVRRQDRTGVAQDRRSSTPFTSSMSRGPDFQWLLKLAPGVPMQVWKTRPRDSSVGSDRGVGRSDSSRSVPRASRST